MSKKEVLSSYVWLYPAQNEKRSCLSEDCPCQERIDRILRDYLHLDRAEGIHSCMETSLVILYFALLHIPSCRFHHYAPIRAPQVLSTATGEDLPVMTKHDLCLMSAFPIHTVFGPLDKYAYRQSTSSPPQKRSESLQTTSSSSLGRKMASTVVAQRHLADIPLMFLIDQVTFLE